MKILLLEPFFTGSHKAWAEGYKKHSQHDVQILSLSGNFWKWRMHGGAVTLAQKFNESELQPDLILATDMLDLTTFLALTKHRTTNIPTAVYFHENQLTYPWSPEDRDVVVKHDRHYGFINYISALAADAIFFNSDFHKNNFFPELSRFLQHFPDHQNLENVKEIENKSDVLPFGLDLERFNEYQPQNKRGESQVPVILWNHRWEFDKNPSDFFQALFILVEKNIDFQIVILGECFNRQPKEFLIAKQVLGDRIIQFGFVDDFADYARWLWQADVLPVTSNQDFFGVSIVEAIYCNCYPILPNRLVYPELIPKKDRALHLYNDFDDLVEKLTELFKTNTFRTSPNLKNSIAKFDWSKLAKQYDKSFENLVNAQ